ncbi:hypothetical protein CQW23_03110 [Capsicum baccatum]|uniref:Transposase-associated domain-containing protein n=1 Tax=Capsicum baccatum TaxID=33114 RepID=A0A2G2XTD5_CAPBA|nr:hypothetical protein CQW23_03110 [Capsicum baccatum]
MENKDRTWMYNRLYPNHVGLREEYKTGVAEFIAKAKKLNDFLIEGTIRCPCWNYKCCKLLSPDVVTLHLYKKGFMLNYTVWTTHEESSAAINFVFQNYVESSIRENNVENSRYSEMVRDAFGTHSGTQNEPNDETNHFYEQLKEASHPLYEGAVHSKDGTRGDWEEFQKSIEEWREIKPTSEDGIMVQPSREDMNKMWTTVVGGPKKGRTYGTGDLRTSSSPSLFLSSSSTLQTVEEMDAMKKQIVELTQKCAANDAKFTKFEELVKKHMPQIFHDEKDSEFDDNYVVVIVHIFGYDI